MTSPTEPPFSREAARAALAATTEGENLLTAVNSVLVAWQAAPVSAAGGSTPDLRAIARQRGLTATTLATDLAALARLDAPALLQVPLPDGGTRLLALTALERERVIVTPQLAGRTSLSREDLAALWNGRATLLWKNYYAIPPRLRPGSTDPRVKQLQELLKGTGHLPGPTSGLFDRPTAEALRAFQRAEGLEPDGKAGERTLLQLYRRAGGFFPPGIVRVAAPGQGPQPKSSGERHE